MNLKQLINLNVYTQSGHYLGKIIDLEIDSNNSRIVKYIIRSSNLIKNLFQGDLIISHTQVVSISKKKMIVEDVVGRVKESTPVPVR